MLLGLGTWLGVGLSLGLILVVLVVFGVAWLVVHFLCVSLGLFGLFGGDVLIDLGDMFGKGLEDLKGVLLGDFLSIHDG